AAADVRLAKASMGTDGSSDPVAGDLPQWRGGSLLGWVAAGRTARAATLPTEKVDLVSEALRLSQSPTAGVIVVRVDNAKWGRGPKVGDFLVVIPGAYGSNILRIDHTSGDVSVVPLKKVLKLSAVLLRHTSPHPDDDPSDDG